jgi:hypothetical protein
VLVLEPNASVVEGVSVRRIRLVVVGAVVLGSLLVVLGASMGVKEARAAGDPVLLAAGT